MKHLLLLFSVLLLSLQPAAFAATHETTATPDSVSLFAYATRGDDGRSGLRFAWSMDGKHWFEIGQTTAIFVAITAVGDRRRRCSIRI